MDGYTIFSGAQSFFLSFYHSGFFVAVKFFLGIYVIVLVVDCVLLLIHLGLGSNIKKTFYGVDLPPSHKGLFMKKWKVIRERLESGDEAQYKISVLEADTIVNDVLDKAGLQGANMRERLEGAREMQVENREQIIWAHKVRNSIVKDDTFSIDEEQARKVVSVYEDFLRSWETL